MDLYIERIKNKLRNAVESGMLNEQQIMAAIDDTLDNLLLYKKNDDGINKVIKTFQDENKKLNKDIIEASEKISVNYKNIYEHIIKDKF